MREDLGDTQLSRQAYERQERGGAEVGLVEALVVAVERAYDARPGTVDAEVATGGALQDLAVGVDQDRVHAEEEA